MKTLKPFTLNTSSPSAEAFIQQIEDGLYDLKSPSEALYVQLYQALADEHQRAIDMKEQEMTDLLRGVMVNVHLILSLTYPDNHTPNPPGAGIPQTIRALMHQRDQLENKT